jgi:AcrR family transcriptional regulator
MILRLRTRWVRTTSGSRREDIRRAALELFAAHGYEATTMADIAERVGIRAPSLYKHVASKQELLADLLAGTMQALLAGHAQAIADVADPVEQLRRAVEAHVRYHARHRLEAFVGNREIRGLVEPHSSDILAQRARYADGFRVLIEAGVAEGVLTVASPKLAAYAILDMGMGVAAWFRPDGEFTENQVVWQETELALRMVDGLGLTGRDLRERGRSGQR